jgi:hypothetical protein
LRPPVVTRGNARARRVCVDFHAMSGVKDIKDMATSVNVGLANLSHGKPLHKKVVAKVRARLHFVVALVGLGFVALVGTYVAKKGLPDIDPVKVRAD